MNKVDIEYSEKIEQKIFFQSKLLEAVNDSIIVAELDGRITFWNKGSEELFGWSSEEVIGKPFSLIFEETNIQDIPTHVNEVHRGVWEGKVPILTKFGEKKYVRVSVTAMYDQQNNPTNLVGVFTDITELIKSKIEAEEALRSKSEFLANVSHEIRTPMTGILGYVELLSNLPMDDKQKQYLHAIKENADQLLDLINDILDLSKIEADKLILEENIFNLRDLVYTITKIFEPTIKNKNLMLTIDIAEDLPEEIISDSVRIKQILSNLVSNAVKFTPQGKINIKAYKGEILDDNRFELCIEVEDTGVGILPNKIPIVFEPFVQADSSTTRKFGGTGLGLAICKKLVEMLGGEITVESEVEKGSKFMFKVPVLGTSSTSRGDIFIAKNTEQKLYKLLFISPDENLFTQMNQALSNSKLELLWAKSSNRISSIIKFYEPDILVLDFINEFEYKELYHNKLDPLSPLLRLYILRERPHEISPLPFNNSTIKYMNSIEALIDDLKTSSIVKETIVSPTTTSKILLVDENTINLMLMNNILSNHGYSVVTNSNMARLSDVIEAGDNFNIVLVDTGVINKHGEIVINKLKNINSKALIGISNQDEFDNDHDIFTDFIYKPVKTKNLLAIVSKYIGGGDY